MKRKTNPQAGLFNLRSVAAVALCLVGASMAWISLAAPAPASAILSTTNRAISYTDSTGAPPNLTPLATGTPNCGPTGDLCSTFNLTIDPTIGVAAAGYDPTQYQITLQWQWATSAVDYDIFVENAANAVVAKNTSTADPSTIVLSTTTAPGTYKLIVVLSTGAPIPYTGTITLEKVASTTGGPGLCDPAVSNCAPARFQSYAAGTGQADNAGEPSLGVDWNPNVPALQHDNVNTGGVAFFTSGSNEFRVNFDDCASPAIYNWEDVSALFDQTFVLSDPIGFVDHYSSVPLGLSYPPPHTPGRIFALDLIGGQGDSLGAYSDNDGNSYLPGGNGGAGAGPDHETIGAGPYAGAAPATASYPSAASPGAKHGVYYCSQNIAAEAQCSRSDDGGQTFGPSVPIFNPTVCTGGIHGHVKVAPDGTVYVPNSACGSNGTAGVAVSTDNGITWVENNVPGSSSSQDPYVGIGQNNLGKPVANLSGTNTIYLGYIDGNGHPKVAFSGNRGATWSTPVDLGTRFGVTHAVFAIAAAGDDNRAAIGFVGTGDGIATTGTCDPYGATLNCKNIWHLYVSTTYDGGQNWITTDATPFDPIQAGTVCLQGTTCAGGRNLLDFNDMAIDSQGRVLLGYADGCVNCSNTFQSQSSSSHGTVTRQSGGRRLFQLFDPIEPAVPANPQMVSAVNSGTSALVTWLEPDNGGSPITGYNIYRGTTSGGETFLASVSGNTTNKYLDPAPPAGSVYYYTTAVNAIGESSHCREVIIQAPTETPCILPGLPILADPAGDIITPIGQTSNPGWDLRALSIAEPYAFDPNKLVFTLKVESFAGGVPPANTRWPIQFVINGGTTAGYWVDMSTFPTDLTGAPAGTVAVFKYGTFNPTGGTGGVYGAPNTRVGNADPLSTFSPDGTIRIVVPRSAVGNPALGAKLTGFLVRVRFGTDTAAVTPDNMPSDLGPAGSYTVVGNQVCRPNTAPTAVLTAVPQAGTKPLTVNFDGSGSFDPDTAAPADTIVSYTFNFGDGSAPVTQASPTIGHQYVNNGDYPARLTVTDSRGKASTNVAQQVISVAGGTPPVAGVVSRKTHTGVGNFDVVMPGIECRSGGSAGNQTLVVVFQNTLVSVNSVTASAVTAGGTQSVTVLGTSAIGSDTHQFFANLSGVPTSAHVAVTLHGVVDSAGNSGDVIVNADFLAGDTTGNGSVNSSDIAQTQSESGHTVSASNFREDVTANGSINSSDIGFVQAQSGTALPAGSTGPAKTPPTKRKPPYKTPGGKNKTL